jgi:hypothetical protein
VIRSKLRRLPAHPRRRRLHVYGVGTGKSGTTTLARMFGEYRAAHEVDPARMVPISTAVIDGDLALDSRRVRFELRRRRARFHLEVDSAPFLNPLTESLAALFPDARFVLTLRDCFSWLDSTVEWERLIPTQDVPLFAPMRTALYRQYPNDFALEEAPLRDAGLRPVANYLRVWAKRNTAVLRGVPAARLLVVRTEDLSGSAESLARFAGVPVRTVHAAHANANSVRSRVLADVPREFIVERAREH